MSPDRGETAVLPQTAQMTAKDEIAHLDRAGLAGLWQEWHAAPPPRSISQPLLRRILGFDGQLRAAGGWPAGMEARLARAGAGGGRPPAAVPSPGGRLLRAWNGTTHVVEITDDGYLWQGRTWRSLSAIAREITGAHWSGPRFFGLAGTRGSQRHAAPASGDARP